MTTVSFAHTPRTILLEISAVSPTWQDGIYPLICMVGVGEW